MDTFQQLIEITSQIVSIKKFCSLVNTYQKLTKFTYSQCPIKGFTDKLRKAVVESDSYENTRNSFSRTCMQNIDTFPPFYKIYDNENIEEITSSVPLIFVEKYNLEKCICTVFLFIWE